MTIDISTLNHQISVSQERRRRRRLADTDEVRNIDDDVSVRLLLRRHLQDDRNLPHHDGPPAHNHGKQVSSHLFTLVKQDQDCNLMAAMPHSVYH